MSIIPGNRLWKFYQNNTSGDKSICMHDKATMEAQAIHKIVEKIRANMNEKCIVVITRNNRNINAEFIDL